MVFAIAQQEKEEKSPSKIFLRLFSSELLGNITGVIYTIQAEVQMCLSSNKLPSVCNKNFTATVHICITAAFLPPEVPAQGLRGLKVFATGEIEIDSSVSVMFGGVRWAFLSPRWRSCATLERIKGKLTFFPPVMLWKTTVTQHKLFHLLVLLLQGWKKYWYLNNYKISQYKKVCFKFYLSWSK